MITPIDNWTLGIMSAYNIYTCEFYIYTEKLLLTTSDVDTFTKASLDPVHLLHA